jgi:hypothetical protein
MLVTVGLSSLVTLVVNCILENTPEFRKAEVSASAVFLSLYPAIQCNVASIL